MRRAGRIIYNLAVGLSLLLWLGTVGVWKRSASVGDQFDWYDWPRDRSGLSLREIHSWRGKLRFSSVQYEDSDGWLADYGHFAYRNNCSPYYPEKPKYPVELWPANYHYYAALGFELTLNEHNAHRYGTHRSGTGSSLTLPLYFPALLFTLLPAHYLLRVRRRRCVASRRARGCCVFCGHDLRASAGPCPECGREGRGRTRKTTDCPDHT